MASTLPELEQARAQQISLDELITPGANDPGSATARVEQ